MLAALEDVLNVLNLNALMPVFQPQVDLRTGNLVGLEVLARWNHPDLGLILPANFITLAEENGLIGEITQQILTRSFEYCTSLGLPAGVTLAINVSPVQLHYTTLPKQIRFAAEEYGFDLQRLTIEVTESALVRNLPLASRIARDLRYLGCRLALDDFGTGYSSLKHLAALPFTDIKIDRSFVNAMMDTREARKIVSAVIGLGQSLSLTTIAEGIKTEEQAALLQRLGCDVGQGWLLGRPPPHRLAELQALYDCAPVALGLLDHNLRFVSVNQRLADFYNSAPTALVGHTVADVLPKVFEVFEHVFRQALAGQAISGVPICKPSAVPGEPEELFAISFQPTFDEDGDVIGISAAIMALGTPVASSESPWPQRI